MWQQRPNSRPRRLSMTPKDELNVRRQSLRRVSVSAVLGEHRYDLIPIELDGILHGLNSDLEFVGQCMTSDGAISAIQLTSAGVTDLGTLGGSASSARGINAEGAIVGGALTRGDVLHHAFLHEGGVMYDLNALISPDEGYELVHALGINDRGDIVAIGHHDGTDRVVLLKRRHQPIRD
jgi:probable HAF family extracellular repeat protein